MFNISRRIDQLRDSINFFLKLAKWPVAFTMILVVPAMWQVCKRYYVIREQLNWHNLVYFAIGAGCFAAIRVMILLQRGKAETLEHEMTHTLFAMATFHRVSGIELKETGGGSMRFSGKGNWLIAIAPYFFPLTAFTMMFFAVATKQIVGYFPDWIYMGLGMTVCYNLFSFAEQTHPHQTDFKVAGYLFTISFLPGANCLSFGTILAFAERGWDGVLFFYRLLWYYFRQDFNVVLNYF
ncbi:MAG: M50 family metallopeptidase [Alphaproteobacteria bacterium]|nr:M50 family metallopeptidase [Alphaproteobacteria bacterium]MBO4643032.1 M50 family metallopeptidase [Alphaproteobacteria bacterium]